MAWSPCIASSMPAWPNGAGTARLVILQEPPPPAVACGAERVTDTPAYAQDGAKQHDRRVRQGVVQAASASWHGPRRVARPDRIHKIPHRRACHSLARTRRSGEGRRRRLLVHAEQPRVAAESPIRDPGGNIFKPPLCEGVMPAIAVTA